MGIRCPGSEKADGLRPARPTGSRLSTSKKIVPAFTEFIMCSSLREPARTFHANCCAMTAIAALYLSTTLRGQHLTELDCAQYLWICSPTGLSMRYPLPPMPLTIRHEGLHAEVNTIVHTIMIVRNG